MAASLPHGRRDPVARFNTFEEPEDSIKAQIASGLQTQRALRSRPLFHPTPLRSYQATNIPNPSGSAHHAPDDVAHTTSPDSSECRDIDRHVLERTLSFNSLSTLHRGAEASRLSQYRDSPVSACVPARRAFHELDQTLEEPCPPIAVYTLKQMRKDQRMQLKSLKRQEKEERKADRAGLQEWRHSQAAAHAAATSQSLLRRAAQTEKVPIRATSDPTNKTAKDAAAHFVRKLTSSRSVAKFTRRPKTVPNPVPHIDDFDSKAELREHLHASSPSPESNVAELPGSLPPYTPFEDSTANATNAPDAAAEDPATISAILRSISTAKDGYCEYEAPKMMRCDLCQFGIRVEEPYFQCSVCNSGDRILCSACDAAGNSCRHELTERVRRVLRYDDGSRQTSVQVAASTNLARKRSPRRHHNTNDPAALPANRSSTQEVDERKYSSQLRDLELRRREQDLSLKDREANLRERELLQRQERQIEAEASKAACSQEHTLQLQSDLMRQYSEMASMLGTQFAGLKADLRASRSVSVSSSTPTDDSLEEAIHLSKSDEGVRQHAGKRKAGNAPSRSGSAKSPKRPGVSPRRSLLNEVDSEDDAGEDGGSRENKSNGKERTNSEKLFACHYCKFDGPRYSERNNVEKAYRGCSSGYWPDISRLKQHLYRVHSRGKHCKRCFTPFKTDAELDRHSQQLEPCQLGEISFQEKFDDAKYHEVKRKRPGKTYEEVWYIIYEILFPEAPRPSSPYADGAGAQAAVDGDSATVQPTWEALGQAFEARLDRHQAEDQQAWLRLPGARSFLLEQLRACMAEVVQQTTPANSPAPPSSSRRPHQPALRLSTQQTPGSSITTSPLPTSATSTSSTSSGRWLLPTHSRSFSRPLNRPWQHDSAQSQHSHAQPQPETARPAVSMLPDNSMDGVTFAVPYHIDPENDQYDDECHSWQEGDELGLAITTDSFNFDFRQPNASTESEQVFAIQDQHLYTMPSGHPLPGSKDLSFKPVKVSSLTDPVPGQATVENYTDLKLNISNASADSGYNSGSMSCRPVALDQPRHKYCKATAAYVSQTDGPVPEYELNLDALDIPYQEFLDGGTDEHGNVGGSNFDDYWTGRYGGETT